MKAIQSWKRNPPSTLSGESVTVVTTYTSFDKREIDGLEKMFPKGWMMSEIPDFVRCRECKHRFLDGEGVLYNVCDLNHNKVMPDDWYCADGEKR